MGEPPLDLGDRILARCGLHPAALQHFASRANGRAARSRTQRPARHGTPVSPVLLPPSTTPRMYPRSYDSPGSCRGSDQGGPSRGGPARSCPRCGGPDCSGCCRGGPGRGRPGAGDSGYHRRYIPNQHPLLPSKRSRPVGLLDLPSPLLEDILLRVADSKQTVDELPASGADDEPVPAFLGDVRRSSGGSHGDQWCFEWLKSLATMTSLAGMRSSSWTPPRTPSAVLTQGAWERLLPVLSTCRELHRAGLSAVRGLILGPEAPSLTAIRCLRSFPHLRLVAVSSALGCSASSCLPLGLSAAPPWCRIAKIVREESLLPEGLRRLSLNGLAYRGQLVPSGLLASLYHGASAPCLKRLVLEGLEGDPVSLGLSKALSAHAPTLVELSLMLPLQATFFQGALRPSRDNPGGIVFPALRRLGVLVTHPPDVTAIVRAAPALTAIRLGTSVTCPSASGPDWRFSDNPLPAGDLLCEALRTTAGRLTSFECTGQDLGGPGFSANSVVDFLVAHAATLRSMRVISAWGLQWETTAFPPTSFGQLSFLMLGLVDWAGRDLGPLLDRLLGAPALFPALVELQLAVQVRAPSPDEERQLRCHLNGAPSGGFGAWALGPSGLQRARLRGPLPMLEAVAEAVTSPSLVALALEGDRDPFRSRSLCTQAVAGLAGRCPALRAVRLDRLVVSGRLVELLDLQRVQGLLVSCAVWPRWPRLDRQSVAHALHDCHERVDPFGLPHL